MESVETPWCRCHCLRNHLAHRSHCFVFLICSPSWIWTYDASKSRPKRKMGRLRDCVAAVLLSIFFVLPDLPMTCKELNGLTLVIWFIWGCQFGHHKSWNTRVDVTPAALPCDFPTPVSTMGAGSSGTCATFADYRLTRFQSYHSSWVLFLDNPTSIPLSSHVKCIKTPTSRGKNQPRWATVSKKAPRFWGRRVLCPPSVIWIQMQKPLMFGVRSPQPHPAHISYHKKGGWHASFLINLSRLGIKVGITAPSVCIGNRLT